MTNATPNVEKDPVNHPSHYTQYPVEVIELTRHMNFGRGNAVKYIARAGYKGGPDKELEDLKKAEFYIKDEIKEIEKKKAAKTTTTVYLPNASIKSAELIFDQTLDGALANQYYGNSEKPQTYDVTITADASAVKNTKAKG